MNLPRRAALLLATAALAAPRARAADLSNVTLRAGTFKGQDELILAAARLAGTPYKLEYREFNSGQLEIEAINAGALLNAAPVHVDFLTCPSRHAPASPAGGFAHAPARAAGDDTDRRRSSRRRPR